ncbi:hypothetical protein F4779DRAFT_239365 [Xylariaceae sp. FL0662B]|nr:hypothetical protein F4779DRAFT_239365 [Xylariaceae sp. FL0662B]
MHANKAKSPFLGWRLGESAASCIQRRSCYWAILAIVFTVTAYTLLHSDLRQHTKPAEHLAADESSSQSDKAWTFDVERDGLNFGLSDYQCEVSDR